MTQGGLPERRPLRAGPIALVFEAGTLRWLTLGATELISAVYVAVRDDRWGTVPGVLEDLRIEEAAESFDIGFVSRHRQAGIDFSWQGHVTGGPDGSIDLTMDGIAASSFRRNRIGICMHHPMTLAGAPMRVIHPDGVEDGALPQLVAPQAPFLDVTGMRWPVGDGVQAVVRFEGDLFEMEDQRNWTDASFKTFSTPLRLPYPVTIEAGTTVGQRFGLRLEGVVGTSLRRPAPDHGADAASTGDVIEVHDVPVGPMPRLGTSLAPGRERLSPAEVEALRGLAPEVLRTVVVLDDPAWPDGLAQARDVARALGADLEIEAVAGDDGSGLEALVADLLRAPGPRSTVFVFPTSSYATTVSLAGRLRTLLSHDGSGPLVGGGSRANLAELNRCDLPSAALDVVGFPVCPQLHVFDDESIMENIAALPVAIRTAQARFPLPMTVGPITLRPRFDAYGQGRPTYGPAADAGRADARQDAPFAAAWSVGCLAAIAGTGVAAVLLHEATGPAGLIGPPDDPRSLAPRPVSTAMLGVMPVRDAVVLHAEAPPGLAVLALRTRDGDRVMVANLRSVPRTVEVRLPRPAPSVTTTNLDGTGVEHDRGEGPVRLRLRAYDVVRVDGHVLDTTLPADDTSFRG